MRKQAAITIVALLAAVATLVIMQHRSETGRLRMDVESLQEQRDQLSALAVENARLSNLVAQSTQPKVSPEQPTHEVLRLRGEVGRLHRDLANLRQESNEEIDNLREQARESPGFSLPEIYGLSGIDTNSLPNIDPHATTNEVLAELRRVGAHFLKTDEEYIHAEVFPTAVAATNSSPPVIGMEFYFEDGRLTSRRDWWRREGTTSQQLK